MMDAQLARQLEEMGELIDKDPKCALIFKALLEFTVSHLKILKAKKGQGMLGLELPEAMRKAGDEIREVFLKHAVKVDPDHESIER